MTDIYTPYKLNLPKPPHRSRLIRYFPQALLIPQVRDAFLSSFPHVQNCQIRPGFYCTQPKLLTARDSLLNDTYIINYSQVDIGRNVRFTARNAIITSTHLPEDHDTVISEPIVIGDNTWITYGCIILGSVTIGSDSVIGAGSVVTNDIPSRVVAAGNPCKVLRSLEPS